MKKLLFVLLASLFSLNSFSQINFEKGYFINNSGGKIDCFIKNIDWKNNPTTFIYKLSENESPKTATIEIVKEFGVNNISKYSRAKVNIDRSSELAGKLSTHKTPDFNEEQLFLKILVEGKANLYYYEDGNLRKYFFYNDNSEIEQLVFKSYNVGGTIHKNNHFRQQLLNSLKCNTISKNDLEYINYKKKELTNLFVKYNECNNSEFTEFEKKQKRVAFNLNIRPGINQSSISYYNVATNRQKVDFDSEISFRIGIEAEIILPFNKNKWALIVEPNYQSYKSEIKTETQTITADYNSIQIPLGVRHYFFLNNDSKIFVNGSFALDFSGKSKIERGYITGHNNGHVFSTLYDIEKGSNVSFGIGYNHNGKYSLEFRHELAREIIKNYVYVGSEYKRVSLIFGYTIF